jgi:hypothetical protein
VGDNIDELKRKFEKRVMLQEAAIIQLLQRNAKAPVPRSVSVKAYSRRKSDTGNRGKDRLRPLFDAMVAVVNSLCKGKCP